MKIIIHTIYLLNLEYNYNIKREIVKIDFNTIRSLKTTLDLCITWATYEMTCNKHNDILLQSNEILNLSNIIFDINNQNIWHDYD
jgi:hypothetical protein